VYLCVVSTALVAGLALTSHTSKAYAQDQNCGRGSSVSVVRGGKPIVCDSGETRTLNSSSGDIEINMDTGSVKEAAVTVKGSGTNITIVKRLKVINGSGKSGSLPVINVLNKGQLTLNEEVDVTKATIKKEIVVNGAGSSVTLNGVLTGFEEVKINDGGVVVLGEKVTGIEKVKVGINGGGMVTLMEDVTFNNGSEAGIKIEGNRAGKATVMGVGGTGEMVTMTVKGNGGGIEVEAGAGKVDATVMMLNIKGSGMGKGVDVQNGAGTMELNKVNVSGFTMGV
uniref:hypothetical protein n=1 Tax=Bartonella bovis TaxID=155194 RepID=UPI001304E4D1